MGRTVGRRVGRRVRREGMKWDKEGVKHALGGDSSSEEGSLLL